MVKLALLVAVCLVAVAAAHPALRFKSKRLRGLESVGGGTNAPKHHRPPPPAPTAAALGAANLTAVSWNIAAINNNPFEYWVEIDDPGYNELMANAQHFVDAPGEKDVSVVTVFTGAMFQQLTEKMKAMNWKGVDDVMKIWEAELSKRKIVSGFLKDKGIGKKRLISMPDRISNTINTISGATVYRPTAINCFPREMATLDAWWKEWQSFMFDTPLHVVGGASEVPGAASLLSQMSKAKYPDLSETEEAISLPLQTLHLAVFDAIMVHMLKGAQTSADDAKGGWHGQRTRICQALNSHKNERVLQILRESYAPTAHVIFLQEVAASFVKMVRNDKVLGENFHVLHSTELDGKRDQNSVVLCRKDTFNPGARLISGSHLGAVDHTKAVMAQIKLDNEGKAVPVQNGDVFAVTVNDLQGRAYFFASFHGDTNGLATIPVVLAVEKVSRATVHGKPPTLVFGLDANTYKLNKPGKMQGETEFVKSFAEPGLSSGWGDVVDPTLLTPTTFNGRTYVQPQLQKAMKKSETREKGDANPKDFIIFHKAQFTPVATTRDNTGARTFTENMLFPTLSFPSDHAVISVTLKPTNVAASKPAAAKPAQQAPNHKLGTK